MATDIDVALTADLDRAGALGSLGGALNVGNPGGLFLGGVISDTGSVVDPAGADTLELLLTGLTGSASAEFGSPALAAVTGEFGSGEGEIFGQGFDQVASTVSMRAVVPLAATLPLATGAFAFLMLVGRRTLRRT